MKFPRISEGEGDTPDPRCRGEGDPLPHTAQHGKRLRASSLQFDALPLPHFLLRCFECGAV